MKTPFGDMPVALYGYSFHWNDILYVAQAQLADLGALSGVPGMLLAVVASSLIVRSGLSPLNSATRTLDKIDLATLDSRLPIDDLPDEVAPFASAVNRTFARLEAGFAAQKRFLANAAHELRTPIAVLSAHIEEMGDRTDVQHLKRDAARIRMLVEQLLASAAISAHQINVAEKVDLAESVLSVVSDCMPLAVGCRRQIELDCPTTPVFAIGNRRAVESVVLNFVDNALHAEPEGGTVLVRVIPDCTIEVVDHGAGVESRSPGKGL